jgi:hypothetical protein
VEHPPLFLNYAPTPMLNPWQILAVADFLHKSRLFIKIPSIALFFGLIMFGAITFSFHIT